MSTTAEHELIWHREPSLRRPIVVMAFEGLFDAAEAATSAVRRLADRHDARPLADIDPERFFDFTEQRPTVHFDENDRRVITWPQNTLLAAARPDADRDLVLLAGIEPHLRWRTFCDHLTTAATATGAEMVVTLGAMVGLAPHTRPLGVVASSTNAGLAERLGLNRPSYEGPTGLVGALHDRLDRDGIPVVSLRVPVPHYVPGPPNPEAARSLLGRLELVTGIDGGHDDMHRMAAEWRSRVDAAVDGDEEMAEYVRSLEAQVDESDDLLPSGDDLAVQLEAFLREQRSSDDD